MEWIQQVIEMLGPLLLPGYLVLELIALLLALEAIFKARTPQAAIAWALGLIFIPPLVVPAYLTLGARRFYGYVEARRQGDLEIQKQAESIIASMRQQDGLGNVAGEGLQQKHRVLESLALMPFTSGNAAALIVNGEQSYREMFAAIDRARHYILLQFYIVRDDGIGWELAEHLTASAARGVSVYFLYDRIGSLRLSSRYVKSLQKAGVEIHDFRAFRWNLKGRFQINFRNHRKLLLIDGEEAFVGGLNIGDEYCHRHPTLTPWRDTQIHLRGPAVSGLQLAFIEDWHWVTGDRPELHWPPPRQPENLIALALPTGPADYQDTCQLMFVDAINNATRRIWLVSPYFVPDESIIKALKLASLRGVEIKILLPGITDNRTAQLASFDFINELRYTRVAFYRYRKGFLHQKVMLLDDDTAYVGTANLDNRSFRLNFELTVVVADKAFNARVEQMLQQDFDNSEPLGADVLRRRKIGFQLLVKIARLFAPLQ